MSEFGGIALVAVVLGFIAAMSWIDSRRTPPPPPRRRDMPMWRYERRETADEDETP